MRYALLLATFAAVAHAGDDEELRFLRAWYALGEPGRRAAAEETFRLLHAAEATPLELKAKCLLGLAECARLRGDEAAARRQLERLLAEAGGTEAAARAHRMLGGDGYLDRIVVVPEGSFLDLDDATLSAVRRPVAGKEAEMRDAEILVEPTAEPGFALLVGAGSGKPWYRVPTSEGRTSWVQVLERGRGIALRVVTRLSGTGDVLPAPRDPFCLGVERGIEVRFEPSRAFAHYRIERGTGGEDPVEIGVVDGPPFLDATAEEGVRYLYRITGEDAGGVRGLPATIEGTRRSRGVVSGVAEMNRTGARGFDFLLGTPVEDGDVALTGIFGDWDGASFVDSLGREIRPLAATHGDPRVAWDEESEASSQIPAGSSFLVPLPGGGVARCRLEIPAQDRREERVEAILHYEACGDGGVLPQPARLSAKRGETGAIVTVEVKPPYRVEQVEVTDLVTGEALAPLPVADGVARDAGAGEGQVRRYRAVPVDAHGRRASAATATIALLPDGPRAGEFRFHYQQGFDLETGRIVDAGEADVFFQECRGGISQITLAAPGGIVSMERVLPKHLNPGRAEAIYDLVVSADPQVALAARAEADSRTPSSDVFLVRTRHGGWAKLAITHRASEGTWMKFLATVKYVFNGQEPVFAQDQGEELGGVRFRDLQRLQARAAILRDWQQGWHRIAQDPLRRQALEEEIREEGEMPDAEATQEVLWSRQRHKDYEKATYSFIFATRDDPGLGRTRNDWCLQYGNGGDMLDVRMVTDDLSTITDLGPGDWALLARRAAIQERETDRTPARFGHIYLVHTLDTDENFFALLRVTALRPGDRVAFEWVARRGDGLTRSPGLALDAPTEKALAALLAQLPETPEKRWEGRDHARAVQQRLQEPEVLIGVVDAAPEAFLRDLSEIAGVRIVLKGRQAGPVTVFGARMTPERILDSVADKTGLRWRIEEDGSVSLE